MNIISSILGAVITGMAYYGTIYIEDKKRDLLLPRKGGWILSRSVLAVGALTVSVIFVLGITVFPAMGLFSLFLQYILIWGMSVLCIIDYKKHCIPNRILFYLLLLWAFIVGLDIILETERGMALFFQSLIGALAGGLIFLLCYILSRRQLGAGDVKLAFIMGLYLTGQRIIGVIFYGILLCLCYSVVQLLRKKIGLKDGVPLSPFLYGGVLITFLIMI